MQRESAGSSQAARTISDGISRVVAEYVGRGPTTVRTTIDGDMVVCVLRDTFTKSERRLVEAGEQAFVKDMRLRFQQTMREDLVAMVVAATGREVEAFFSDHHLDPDIAIELFLLVPERG